MRRGVGSLKNQYGPLTTIDCCGDRDTVRGSQSRSGLTQHNRPRSSGRPQVADSRERMSDMAELTNEQIEQAVVVFENPVDMLQWESC